MFHQYSKALLVHNKMRSSLSSLFCEKLTRPKSLLRCPFFAYCKNTCVYEPLKKSIMQFFIFIEASSLQLQPKCDFFIFLFIVFSNTYVRFVSLPDSVPSRQVFFLSFYIDQSEREREREKLLKLQKDWKKSLWHWKPCCMHKHSMCCLFAFCCLYNKQLPAIHSFLWSLSKASFVSISFACLLSCIDLFV